jgi:Arc/MetJ-type ribon-helix-helix transcriptional regulator
MTTINVRVPDGLAEDIQSLVQGGRCLDAEDVALSALRDFVRRNRLDLQEEHQREDIEWAKTLKRTIHL